MPSPKCAGWCQGSSSTSNFFWRCPWYCPHHATAHVAPIKNRYWRQFYKRLKAWCKKYISCSVSRKPHFKDICHLYYTYTCKQTSHCDHNSSLTQNLTKVNRTQTPIDSCYWKSAPASQTGLEGMYMMHSFKQGDRKARVSHFNKVNQTALHHNHPPNPILVLCFCVTLCVFCFFEFLSTLQFLEICWGIIQN